MSTDILEILQIQLQNALVTANVQEKDRVMYTAKRYLNSLQKERFLEFYAAYSQALQIEIQSNITSLEYKDLRTQFPRLKSKIRVLKTSHRQKMRNLLEAQTKCLVRHYQLGLEVSDRRTFHIG